jgi:hypothetical protein
LKYEECNVSEFVGLKHATNIWILKVMNVIWMLQVMDTKRIYHIICMLN